MSQSVIIPARWQHAATAAGVVVFAACAFSAMQTPGRMLEAYLSAYIFWLGAPLGGLAFLMLHKLTGGRWGGPLQLPLRAAASTMPFMAVLFLPVIMGLPRLYAWAQPGAVEHVRGGRMVYYLNPTFFIARAVGYFVIWCVLTILVLRRPTSSEKGGAISAAGLVLYFLTVSFAAIDWGMSLDPHWRSTIYGMIFVIDQTLVALCAAVLMSLWLGRSAAAAPPSRDELQDIGNLLLMLVSLWAYLAFSQFLIMWSGNLPAEVVWYVPRTGGGWGVLAAGLIVFHFAVPLLLLLSRSVKRNAKPLAMIAGLLLIAHLANVWWLLVPSFARPNHRLDWREPAATAGLGMLWLGLWLRQVRRRQIRGETS